MLSATTAHSLFAISTSVGISPSNTPESRNLQVTHEILGDINIQLVEWLDPLNMECWKMNLAWSVLDRSLVVFNIRKIIFSVANDLALRFSIHFREDFGEPLLLEEELSAYSNEVSIIYDQRPFLTGRYRRQFVDHEIASVVTEINSGTIPRMNLLQQYRTAVNLRGSVSQFIALYHILAQISFNNSGIDRFDKVDELIRTAQPMYETRATNGPRGLESPLTRLRHEISHPERQQPLTETTREMEDELQGLKLLVKTLVY